MNLSKQSKKIGRQAVLVIWIDSSGVEGWTHEPIEDLVPVKMWTLGWILADTKSHVTITATASYSKAKDYQVNSPIAIPRCSIIKMEYLTD